MSEEIQNPARYAAFTALFLRAQEPISMTEARRLLDAYAHELAERQRHHFGIGDAPVRAHCDPDCDYCRGVTAAANLIDPEVQR